jgi:hypothetical protein
MSVFKNEKDLAVKVQFRIVGKAYSIGGEEGTGVIDTPEKTTYPFEEVIVEAGQTVDLGNVEVLDVVDMSVVSEAATKSFKSFVAFQSAGTQSA